MNLYWYFIGSYSGNRFDHDLPTGVDDNELLQRDKYYF